MAGTCVRRVLGLLTLVVCSVAPSVARRLGDDGVVYRFAYDVHNAGTGDSKGHFESRRGDVVRGSYSLLEPDGSRRTVEYVADPVHGFNAVVRRESPATAFSDRVKDSGIAGKKYRYPKRGLDAAFAIAGTDPFHWLPPSGYRSGRGYLLPGSAIVTAGAFV